MLRAWALTLALLSLPLLYFIKPRIPLPSTSQPPPSSSSPSTPPPPPRRNLNYRFILTPSFLILQTGNILQSLGFFMPNIYLPTYAAAVGLPPQAGAAALALANATSVCGQIALGALSDRLHITTVIALSTGGAALSVFVGWGLAAASLPLLCVFALVYGVSAGAYTASYTGMIRAVRASDPRAEPGLVFGLLAAGRGVGSVVAGPLSEALVGGKRWEGEAAGGYGTGFGPLIVFTGVSALLGGVSVLGRRVGWL